MEIISTGQIQNHYRLSDVKGKKVISASGKVVGRVKDIAYDLNKIIGIYVGNAIIGKEYIGRLNTDSIILKINPVTSFVGMIVFDKDGKKVGKVSKTIRSATVNDFVEITVRKNALSKPFKIVKADIEVIGKNIILNKIL